uniref:L-fucose kinase n=1 Tax=Electrophorus electricus TaxID=8005 RepID=A0A4W4DQI8_ELEEL
CITFKNSCWLSAILICYFHPLEVRQQRGLLPPGALLLTVADPKERLGSGGATLNALLVATEHLSARAGYTVVTADVLDTAHILILHTGRDFPWDGCSRAFCWMPVAAAGRCVDMEGPVCCLDMLLDCLSTKMCVGSPPGVWVCSTDMILSLPTTQKMSWKDFSGVRVVSLPGDISFAAHHGVYLTDAEGGVRDIIYRGSEERIQTAAMPDGKVPLVSGPVFFSTAVSEKLLQTHVTPPLDGCTYMGMDSGAPPLQVCTHTHSTHTVLPCVSEASRVINSVLEGAVHVVAGAVVQHCHLQGPVKVHSGCLLSGLDLASSAYMQGMPLTSDIIMQGHRVQLGELKLTVFTVFGAHDSLEVPSDADTGSFLNRTWSQFFNISWPEELWGAECGVRRCLLDARLFPVFKPHGGAVGLEGVRFLLGGSGTTESWRAAWRLSLKEVLSLADQQGELRWREELFFSAGRRRAVDTLKGHTDHNLLPSIRAAVLGGQQGALLQALDSVASSSSADLGVAARTLACIADVLGCLAGEGRGGLRSGPAANPSWTPAFRLLEQGKLAAGVQELANQRAAWLSRPDLLVRAARHYEGAGQILLRKAVMSARKFVFTAQAHLPPMGKWQEVECPARLDLSGGWSDTPPIAFEHGGVVVNMAVRVDGRRPIGARARRVAEPHLVLVSTSGAPGCSMTSRVVCEVLADLDTHCQPHAPGALLKAVCVCSDVVCVSSPLSLEQQLLQHWGGGLELHSWSLLPHGSGLGTSSILAGAVLAAVYRCTGRSYDTSSLIHAVLHLEQILTTGGGWQDQVGGLVGGLKLARSHAALPLRVDVEQLTVPQDFLAALQERLLLVYTGKTRLARNLLQDVVRNWYSRLPSIVQNAEQLVSNAEECAHACSLPRLGASIDRYWQQKKAMAPGCEPAAVRTMMNALRPLTLGQSLAGAGGGGFLFILMRDAHQEERVQQILHSTPGLGDFSLHSVELDTEGITVLQQNA